MAQAGGHRRACKDLPRRRRPAKSYPRGQRAQAAPPQPFPAAPHVNRKPHAAAGKHRPPAHVTRPGPARPRRPLIGGSGAVDHIRSGTAKVRTLIGHLETSLSERRCPAPAPQTKRALPGVLVQAARRRRGGRAGGNYISQRPPPRPAPPRPWRPSAGLAGCRESVPSKHWREPRRLRHGGGAVRAGGGAAGWARRRLAGGRRGSGPWTSSSTK